MSQALAAVRACERRLAASPAPTDDLAARLHREIARLCEHPLGDRVSARAHYARALAASSDPQLADVEGLLRTRTPDQPAEVCLEHLALAVRLTPSPAGKARHLVARARLLRDELGDLQGAREALEEALTLCPQDREAARECEGVLWALDDVAGLGRLYERVARALAPGHPVQAALLAARGRLADRAGASPAEVAALYEAAADADPETTGVVDALRRLRWADRDWRALVEAERVRLRLAQGAEGGGGDALAGGEEGGGAASERVAARLAMARLWLERLGDPGRAAEVLEAAVQEADADVREVVLETLAGAYAAAGDAAREVETLRRLLDAKVERRERLGLLHRMGQLLQGPLGAPGAAARTFEEARALDPAYAPVLQALGSLYAAHGEWGRLLDVHLGEAGAVEDAPRRAAALARAAELLEQRLGRVEDAIETYHRALTQVPGHPVSVKALDRLYRQLDRPRARLALFEQRIEDAPERDVKIAFLFEIARIHEDRLDDHVEASHTFQRILRLAPGDLGALHGWQRAAERAGRYEELVEALREEARLSDRPGHAAALLHRVGEVYAEHLGDEAAAIKSFRQALEADPRHKPALMSLGRVYYRLGRWEELVEMHRRELEVTPQGPQAVSLLLRMGEIFRERLGRVTEALGCYRRALELDPAGGPALTVLITELRQRGQWAALRDVLELALREGEVARSPRELARLRTTLGEILLDHLEDPAAARVQFEAALELAPGYEPALDGLLRLLTETGEWEELARRLERFAARIDDDRRAGNALFRAGEIWRDRLGEPLEATRCFEETLARRPGDVPALLALERHARAAGDRELLARVLERQAAMFEDDESRAAALVALAALAEAPAERVSLLRAAAALRPGDAGLTARVAQAALAAGDGEALLAVAQVDGEGEGGVGGAEAGPGACHVVDATRRAELLEAAGSPDALAAYRAAVRQEPARVAAALGLARVAAARDDLEAQVEAYHRLADALDTGMDAADALVRAARLEQRELGDREGAMETLERALEVCPDHEGAAADLDAAAREMGARGRLMAVLARAAEAASPARAAALWRRVAAHHDPRRPDELTATRRALRRALTAAPEGVEAALDLARVEAAHGDPRAAAELLREHLEGPGAGNGRISVRLHMALAEVLGDALDRPEEALTHAAAAARLAPDDVVCQAEHARRLAMAGRISEAREVARQAVAAGVEPAEQAAAWSALASVETEAGALEMAREAILEGAVVAGPAAVETPAAMAVLDEVGGWADYATAVGNYLQAREERGEPDPAGYIALARTLSRRLRRPAEAQMLLQRGLAAAGDSASLRVALAEELERAGRVEEALDELREYVRAEPVSAEAWRALSATFERAGLVRAARLTGDVLEVLGAAGEREAALRASAPPRPFRVPAGALGPAEVSNLSAEHGPQRVAGEVLALASQALDAVLPSHLLRLPAGQLQPVSRGSPLDGVVRRAAVALGARDVQAYVAVDGGGSRDVALALTEPVSLLIPPAVLRLDEGGQAFAVGRALALVARGEQLLWRLSSREVQVVLAVATRVAVPGFGVGVANESFLDERARALERQLGRRQRRALEAAAERYAAGPPVDVEAWREAAVRTANRVAGVGCDDLVAAVGVLAGDGPHRGARVLERAPDAADLVRRWVTHEAVALRRAAGMLDP